MKQTLKTIAITFVKGALTIMLLGIAWMFGNAVGKLIGTILTSD